MWTTTWNLGGFHTADIETLWQEAAEGSCKVCGFLLTVSMAHWPRAGSLPVCEDTPVLWVSCGSDCGGNLIIVGTIFDTCSHGSYLLLKPSTNWALHPTFIRILSAGVCSFKDCSFRTTVLLRTWEEVTPGIHPYLESSADIWLTNGAKCLRKCSFT